MSPEETKVAAKMVCPKCHEEFSEQVEICPRDNTLLVSALLDPLVGTTFADHYEILEVIGRGGMCVVYKARHLHMQNFVAIKVLYPQYGADPSNVLRFKLEAQAAVNIKHPNVIQVLDFGITPDQKAFLIMEYLQGESLSDWLQKNGDMPVDKAMNLFVQVCDGLAQAHKNGVIHRDLKPGNLVLIAQESAYDLVKIVDFGIAKLIVPDPHAAQNLTQPGEVFGSPLYMSPEQCQGDTLDARSDIYSLGCVMYETLSGIPPFQGKNSLETMNMHVSVQPLSVRGFLPDKDIPPLIDAAVLKALKKDPDKRQQSALELKKELIDAAQQSRIYFQETAGYAPDIYGGNTTQSAKVYVDPIEQYEKAAQPPSQEARQVMLDAVKITNKEQAKNQQLKIALITAGWLFTVCSMIWGYKQFVMSGPPSDPATRWSRNRYLDAIIDGERAKAQGDYQAAARAYERAVDISKDFGDGNEKKLKSLFGLLTSLEQSGAGNDQINAVRQKLLQANLKHLEYQYKQDPNDFEQITDLDAGMLAQVGAGKLDGESADNCSKELVNEARVSFKNKQYIKAISWLQMALALEEQAHGRGGVLAAAKEFAQAPEAKEHIEEIKGLLKRAEIAEAKDR